jgi:hypothetical protein
LVRAGTVFDRPGVFLAAASIGGGDSVTQFPVDFPRQFQQPRFMQPHRGSTILVLGILGLILCPICSPIAWAMANRDIAAMDTGLMDPIGMEQTKAGKICGIIGTFFFILVLVALIIVGLVFGVAIFGAAATQGSMQ